MSGYKYINKINALLAKAASTEFDGERELLLEKADQLMLEHAIDRSSLSAAPGEYVKPTVGKEDWEDLDLPCEFGEELHYLLHTVITHCNCRVVSGYRKATIVGFPEDIEFARQLWPIVMIEMVRHLYPKWKKDATFDTNVYNFVKGGYKWQMICDAANEAGVEVKWPDSGRLKRAYRRECKARNEEPTAHTQRHSAFRKSYAQAYQAEVSRRLREMRRRNSEGTVEERDKLTLALRDTAEQVDAEFYRLYPQYDPETLRRQSAEAAEAERLRRESLTDEERRMEDERYAKAYERARKHYDAMRSKEYEPNGWAHGVKVAKDVDLSGGKGHITPNRKEVDA